MSAIKRWYEDRICELAEETGYDYCYLIDRFNECMEDDYSWDEFAAIARERDW